MLKNFKQTLSQSAIPVAALIAISIVSTFVPEFLSPAFKLLMSALFLYQMIFLPVPPAIVSAVAFVAVLIFFCGDPADAALRALTASLVLGFRRGPVTLPAFISLFLAWGVYLIMVQLNPGLAAQVTGNGWLDVLILLISELTLVSIFVVFCAYRTPAGRTQTRELSGIDFFVHLNAAIFIFLSGAGALFFAIGDRQTFSQLLAYIDGTSNAILVVLLPLFFTPVLSGLASAWITGSLLGTIRSIVTPQGASKRPLVLISELMQSFSEVEKSISRLRRTEEERRVFREEKTRLAEQIVSLGSTLDADYRAVCVVDSDMRLIWANSAFVGLFSVATDQIGSTSLADIERFSPWYGEIGAELRTIFQSSTVDGRCHVWSTFGIEGQYMAAGAVLSTGLYRGSKRIEAVLTLEQRTDLRSTVGQMLEPRPSEHCAIAAVSRAGEARRVIAGVSGNLSRIAQLVSNTLTFDPDGALAILERMLPLLTETEAEAKRVSSDLAALCEKYSIESLFDATGEKSNFDIDAAIEMAARQCRENVPNCPPITVLRSSDQYGSKNIPYVISAPQLSCSLLVAYVSTVIRLLSVQSNDRRYNTVVKLEHENLTTEVTSILPGSNAGRYVRLELSRRGTRVREDLIGEQPAGVYGPENHLEAALSLLAQLIRTMGGIVSIQYSAHRGVTISLYLCASEERRPSRPRRNSHNIRQLIDRRSSLRDILVLSPAEAGIVELTDKLKNLGYEVSIERPDSVLREINRSMGVSGSGFEAVTEQASGEQHSINLAMFKLLVVDVADASAAVMAVLEQLEEEFPEVARILVSPNTVRNPAVERYGVPLPVTIDNDLLAQAIDDLFFGKVVPQ